VINAELEKAISGTYIDVGAIRKSINEMHRENDLARTQAQDNTRQIIDLGRTVAAIEQRTQVMAIHVADLKTTLSRIYESAKARQQSQSQDTPVQIGGSGYVR
jgi:regulator of replication initiation timing